MKLSTSFNKKLNILFKLFGLLMFSAGIVLFFMDSFENSQYVSFVLIWSGLYLLFISSTDDKQLVVTDEQSERSRKDSLKSSRKPIAFIKSPIPYLVTALIIVLAFVFKG